MGADTSCTNDVVTDCEVISCDNEDGDEGSCNA